MIKRYSDSDEIVILLCQRIVQPIGELYTTTIPWQVLKKIAFTNPRILMGIDENGKEEYLGIQRILSKDRQKEISDYINKDSNATFPSSIIINIPKEEIDVIQIKPEINLTNVKNDVKDIAKNIPEEINDTLLIPDLYLFIFKYRENVAQIIDGQHRMSGFENTSFDLRFDLPVTIFVEQLIEKQAEIFSTINGKQTRVTPSLVYDLFGLTNKRSPYKVANEIVKLLNESDSSPLKNWIRILGKANEFYAGYITQSTVVKNILMLYCGNIKQAEEDKRVLAVGGLLDLVPTHTSRVTIFRKLYIDKEEGIIYKAILNFFIAVKLTFPSEWERDDTILKKTVGFNALFKVFIDLSIKGMKENKLSLDFYQKQLSEKKGIDFNGILLSSKGVNQLYERIKS